MQLYLAEPCYHNSTVLDNMSDDEFAEDVDDIDFEDDIDGEDIEEVEDEVDAEGMDNLRLFSFVCNA